MKRVIILLIAITLVLSGCEYVVEFLMKDVPLPESSEDSKPTPTQKPEESHEELNYITRYFPERDDVIPPPNYDGNMDIYTNADTFNPLQTANYSNLKMLRLIFESLIRVDDTLKPVGVLAESWSVEAAGFTIKIRLKQDVRWHDGAPFTSFDVWASYEAARYAYNPWYREVMENIANISVISDYELDLELYQPETNFVNKLDIPIIQAQYAMDEQEFAPVGTGPYMYEGVHNSEVLLHRSAIWHGGSLPYIKTITAKLLPERDLNFFAFEAREIDFIETTVTNLSKFKLHENNRIVTIPANSFNYIGFNFDNAYLEKLAMRRSIAHAVDKEYIYKYMMLSNGHMVDSFVSPEWWLFCDTQAYEYSLSAASALAETVIDGGGISLRLLVSEDNLLHMHIAGMLYTAMNEIGIQLTIDSRAEEHYNYAVQNGEYDMYIGSINFSADLNLSRLLEKTATTRTSRTTSEYSGMQVLFAPYLQRLNAQTTDDGRFDQYGELQRKFAEQLPCIPLYYDARVILHDKQLISDFRGGFDDIYANVNAWYTVK